MAKVEGAPAHGNVAHLLPLTYKRYVSEWLEEDTPSFDYGGFVVGEEQSEAKLLGKSEVRRIYWDKDGKADEVRASLLASHSSTRSSSN